jgi:hypothetical protein
VIWAPEIRCDVRPVGSTNPGGKPKELKEIQLEARKMSFGALKTLEAESKNCKSPAAAARSSGGRQLDRLMAN